MAEQTEGTIEIDASPAEIVDVITEFEAYPEWVDGIRSAEVRDGGEAGRPSRVAFEFSAMGFTASYTLRYEYDGDEAVRWTTEEAEGSVKDIRGEYVLEALNGDTRVTYRLGVELAVKVPGFLKRQGDKRAIKTALEGLKQRVESRR